MKRARKFACTICSWKFYESTALKSHMQSHTGEKCMYDKNLMKNTAKEVSIKLKLIYIIQSPIDLI